MTKHELASKLAEEKGINKSAAIKAVEGMMEIMSGTFARKESVFLRGFGTFKIVMRKGKTARDITKGQPIVVPARYAVKFVPCNNLKRKIQ